MNVSPRSFSLAPILKPESVAIIGFSSKPGSASQACLKALKDNGYPGHIHLVGRTKGEIDGMPILGSVEELPVDVDLALLLVPAQAVLDAVQACVRRRVRAGVVFASGFAEMGGEARKAQDHLAEVAHAGNMALMGPNCLGYTNYLDRFHVGFLPQAPLDTLPEPVTSGVAVVMQSGGLMGYVQRAFLAKNLNVLYRVSTGNEVVVEIADFIDHFADDAALNAIVVYAEHVRHPQRFCQAVRKARANGKHVVMIHPGKGERAQAAAASHTGAMASDHAMMSLQVQQAGALLVDSLEALIDTSELLARFPTPPTKGAAVLTSSGAFCAYANDVCEPLGLELPAFSSDVMASLKARMPDFVELGNPFDLTTQIVWDKDLTTDIVKGALSDPRIGSVIVVVPFANADAALYTLNGIIEAKRGQPKPVMLSLLDDATAFPQAYLDRIRQGEVICNRSSERSLRALALVTEYGRREAARAENVRPSSPSGSALTTGQIAGSWAEWEGKRLLAAQGVPICDGALCRSLDEGLATASRIGYPVVMKLQSRQLTHKTEVGGVLLNIADAAAFEAGWKLLLERAGAAGAGDTVDGILVEQMAGKGLELMIGAKRDPQWGAALIIGLGGIWVEALADIRLVPVDASPLFIEQELRRLRSSRLLGPFRGAPARDVAAVARMAASIGALMQARPDIVEIDINPVVVFEEGQGALALDALVVSAGVSEGVQA